MPLCIKSGGSMLAINIRHLVNTSTCPDSFNKYLLSLLCAGYQTHNVGYRYYPWPQRGYISGGAEQHASKYKPRGYSDKACPGRGQTQGLTSLQEEGSVRKSSRLEVLLLNNKLKILNILRAEIYWNLAAPHQAWLGVLHCQELLRGFHRDKAEVRKVLIGYSITSWLFLIGCPQHLDFITLRNLLTGLDFGLLTQAAKALGPPQSNGLFV